MTTEFHASDTVGGYRLEARLGGGGFGTVWRARRLADNRLVALKLLPGSAGDDDLRIRADVELLAASAAAASDHVVRVIDGGTEPVPFVAMEYIYGITLADELRQRQKLPQQEVIQIGLAIADALRAINAAGIVHRDVKPSNVMIERGGTVKLTDFGIAKIAGFDAVTLTGQLPLSIAYAAPEVWEGRAEHRSDLYALAILLYQCLTGALPFRGAYAELFYQHRNREPDLSPLPSTLAPSLLQMIRTCMEKSPLDRPLDAEACIELLERAATEVVSPAAPEPERRHEPDRFGPWLKQERVEGQAWAWYVQNETTGQDAIIELHFADSIAYGEALRRAVGANDRLAPLGAQRILATNRLILRPTEAWEQPVPDVFQFWVAREDRILLPPPQQVTPRIALRVVEALIGIIEAADEEGLPLKFDGDSISLLPEGDIYLRHPGFPPPGRDEPERQALTYLRELPLTREVRAAVARASGLDDARRAFAMLTSVRDLNSAVRAPAPAIEPEPVPDDPYFDPELDAPPADEARRKRSFPPWLALAGVLLALGLGVAGAFLLLGREAGGGGDEPQVVPAETAVATPVNPQLQACFARTLPAPIAAIEAACLDLATYEFDPSCQRGEACARRTNGAMAVVGVNDRSVAFLDGNGNLALAREDGSEAMPVDNIGRVAQPAWSPDGRYLAYLTLETVVPPATPVPSPGTPQPGAGAPLPPGPYYSTQIHIVEADRPANQGVVIATNSLPGTQPHLQRHAIWPQWSPDGKTLYYLSVAPGQLGGAIHAIRLPLRGGGNDIDFSQLRTGYPANETRLPDLTVVQLNAADFGQNQATLGRFSVMPSGELYVQICEGERARPSCGLGRWNGRANTPLAVPISVNRVVEPPVAAADGAYAFVKEANGMAGVIRFGPDGVAVPSDIRLPVPSDAAAGAGLAVQPALAVTRRGDALLAMTAPGQLSGIRIADGASSPWRAGSAPSWFGGIVPAATVAPLPTAPFTVPTPEPSPTVTPVPTPAVPQVRRMTINLTAQRGASFLAGASVVALVGNDQCGTGTTDSTGRVVLSLPANNAPASCTVPNALIRFQVNGSLVEATTRYDPLSGPSLNLVVP